MAAVKKAKKKSAYLVYKGSSDERSFVKGDWRRLDIVGQDDVSWNPENKHRVLKSDLAPKAIEYLLTSEEGDFVEQEQTE